MRGFLKTKLRKTLFISLLVPFILSLLLVAGALRSYESLVSDSFYSSGNPLDDIVIVEIDDYSLQQLDEIWPLPRRYYAQVLQNLNTSKVIGIDIEFFTNSSESDDSQLAASLNQKTVLAMKYDSFSFENGKLQGENVLLPIDRLGTPGEEYQVGYVNIYTDPDGKIRTFIPKITDGDDYNHFSVAIANEYTGFDSNLKAERTLIKFHAETGGYSRVSLSDIYFNQSDFDFQNKIVLIGVTTPGAHDIHAVPISEEMPGVEIHANLIQSIITKDFISMQDDISTMGMIFLFALFAGLILYRFKIHIATAILAVLAIIFVIISIMYIFPTTGVIMNILFPCLSLTFVYIPLVAIFYITEEKSRKWITDVFGKYVSPVIIDSLLKNPEKLKLGGEKRNITLFFSDIRKFTSISEKLAPEELVHLLNEYLDEMTSIIMKHHGLVDKYMGDAIMAFWGAPLDQPEHAAIACASSLEMLEKLQNLQKKWKKDNVPSFEIGIGLNSGEAIVGNMGSSKRFDYTVIGDNVNIASRMEGLNKIYGTNIIISENTYKVVKEQFETRKLDAVRVKGKRKPIHIYELIAAKDKLSEKQREFIQNYEEGLGLYFQKEWKPALAAFQKSLRIKNDHATKVFINRCQTFLKNPPAQEWDGVWEMQTK